MPTTWAELLDLGDRQAAGDAVAAEPTAGRGLFKRLRESISTSRQALGAELSSSLFETLDTAGRLHTRNDLMEELAKVGRVIDKRLGRGPSETLIVVDSTTGQNGLRQAKVFSEAVEVTGVALTKLDGTAKGGIALAIAGELGIPVKVIGVGESIEDLRPFDAREFSAALVGE